LFARKRIHPKSDRRCTCGARGNSGAGGGRRPRRAPARAGSGPRAPRRGHAERARLSPARRQLFDIDTWHEVFSTLQKNVLRTAMTAWGVFWGAFMLVVMLGIGRGLEGGVTRNMASLSANDVFL